MIVHRFMVMVVVIFFGRKDVSAIIEISADGNFV
jgi:hypothetical protein